MLTGVAAVMGNAPLIWPATLTGAAASLPAGPIGFPIDAPALIDVPAPIGSGAPIALAPIGAVSIRAVSIRAVSIRAVSRDDGPALPLLSHAVSSSPAMATGTAVRATVSMSVLQGGVLAAGVLALPPR
ncbi:MAG: hypothetical protein ABIQ09_15880 [Jatrophihabitantaceae bacterium]